MFRPISLKGYIESDKNKFKSQKIVGGLKKSIISMMDDSFNCKKSESSFEDSP